MPAAASKVNRITWFGHATALFELGDRRLLVDPFGRGRTRRAGPVDAVLITHAHVDHLNRWSLRAIDRSAHLVVPVGTRQVVADLGFAQVTEVTPGRHLDLGGVDVIAVPTRHDGGRWRKSNQPEACGYVVQHDGICMHHAGDVDFSDHAIFDDLGKRFRIDATLLPIGGMMPVWWYRWRRQSLDRGVHIDPDCAIDIYERLGATTMVPVHWGTLHLRLGLPSMPRRRLVKVASERGLDRRVQVLEHGASIAVGSEEAVVAERADDADGADDHADHRAEDPVLHRRSRPVVP